MPTWLPTLLFVLALAGLVAALTPTLDRRWRLGGGIALLACCAGLIQVRLAAGDVPVEVQQILNGLFLGSIYALIALGYTMVYGVLKLINFAHGEVFMIGGFVAFFTLTVYEHSSPFLAVGLALLVAMVGCALLGVIIERAAYRPLRNTPRLAALITAIGVSLLLQNIGLLLLGAKPKTVPSVMPTTPFQGLQEATGLTVNLPNLFSVGAAVVLMVGLQFFVSKTKPGRAMRAVSEDRDAARLMGVNVDAIISLTFILGSALAGAAGVLWGVLYPSIRPTSGILPGLKAFVAAVLGGIGSVPGAMIGGLLIGLIEVLVLTVQLSPETLVQIFVTLLFSGIAWRMGQTWWKAQEGKERGRLIQGGAAAGVVLVFWLLGGLIAGVVTPLVAEDPEEASLRGSTFRDAVVYLILIVVLIFKPTGIMGRFEPEKV